MLWANSPWSAAYTALWQTPLSLPYTEVSLPYPPLFWINEGLMTLFFLVVGLELKREFISGALSLPGQVLLPAVAACGGMLTPALFYIGINWAEPAALQGWAIPVATDIAFALGALSLFNGRLPASLKVFLLALAIFDDVGAILIISFFYTRGFAWLPFLSAVLFTLILLFLSRKQVKGLLPYFIAGLFLWFCLLQAGIHPTIAGVILALTLPYEEKENSSFNQLEEGLHPWVAYAIMPLFALANAGFSLSTISGSFEGKDKVTLGLIVGLALGKPLGVLSCAWLAIRLKLAKLPEGASWLALWGVSILCGIGFTMSLFLGTLAFINSEFYMTEVRLGVFIGSILSGLMGAAVLFLATQLKTKGEHPLSLEKRLRNDR